jgi:preprotein translocase subunit Sec63
MAYETLTDEEKLSNYRIYGHPDGSKMSKAVQLAMPSFLMNEDYKVYNLAGMFLLFVFGPLGMLAKKVFGEKREDYGIDYEGLEEMFMKSQQLAADGEKLTDEAVIDLYFQTKEMKELQSIRELIL